MTEQIDDQLRPDDVAPEPEQVTQPEPPKRDWTDEDAAEAKAFGWKAPEEWAGDKPDGYIDDPRRYMERASNFRPFRELRKKFEETERDYQERFKRLETVASRTLEQQRAQYEREMEAIRQQQIEAVETADRGRFEALEKRKADLLPPPPMQQAPQVPQVAPEVVEYEKANEWVRNPILREAGARLIEAGGMAGKPVMDQLRYAEQEVRKLYPGAFQAPAAPVQAAKPVVQRVDGGGLGGGARQSTFDKLPPEGRSAFMRFVSQGDFKDTPADRERYANDYFNP